MLILVCILGHLPHLAFIKVVNFEP